MIKTGDRLLCINGNACYIEGETYTVGEFVNQKYFELMTGHNDEHWYATMDDGGIHVRFDSLQNDCSDAWFHELESKQYA